MLTDNVLTVSAAAGLSLVGYTAEPHSPSAQAIDILAIWIATEEQATDFIATERDRPTRATE